jgi:hypothetical protein
MRPQDITKQVFISYVRKDRNLADALANELQKKGFKVWLDKNISPGAKWSEEVSKALDESDSMIAILNQYSFSSSYVRNELEYVLFNDRYKNRFLPVLIGPTSNTDFVRLPWVLQKITFLKITGQKSASSIAKTISRKFIALLEKEEGSR